MLDRQDLVKRLVPDPANPRDLTMINGFVGESSVDNCTRLYRNLQLTIWQDIPDDQIVLHDSILPGAGFPYGEDLIWMQTGDAFALQLNMARIPGQANEPVAGGVDPPNIGGDYGGYHKMWP